MPQISAAHAVARVRVLEGRMLRQERLDRMAAAADAQEAAKLMEEAGYSLGEAGPAGYEQALGQAQSQACALLRELTPNPRLTDCFLLQYDFQNAKLVRKAMLTGADVTESLSACGTVPPEILAQAVRQQDYHRLPPELAGALVKVNARLSAHLDPFAVDQELDRAWIQAVMARCADDRLARQYFTDLVDLTNLRSVLRAQKAGLGREQAARQLLPLGSVEERALLERAGDPEKLYRLYEKKPYAAQLRRAMEEGLAALERMQDDHLLSLYRAKRHETIAIEPLIGYFLGKTREISMLRLMMAGKINGCAQETLRERLRALYV